MPAKNRFFLRCCPKGGLRSESDKPFVVKHATKLEFTGYGTLEAAALANSPAATCTTATRRRHCVLQEIPFSSNRQLHCCCQASESGLIEILSELFS